MITYKEIMKICKLNIIDCNIHKNLKEKKIKQL